MDLSTWLRESKTKQGEFARAIGVTQGRVSQLARGHMPSLELASRIETATSGQVRAIDLRPDLKAFLEAGAAQ